MNRLLLILKRGAGRMREFPQLFFTIAVAIAILASFAYVADRFLSIARDAQEQLINVRVGALQDGFAPLATELYDDPARLRAHMQRLMELNPAITEFDIVARLGDHWIIANSADEARIGESVLGQDSFLSLASGDPMNSYTIEEAQGGERFFRTIRAIQASDGSIQSLALTRQSLSEADRRIAESIRNSSIILVFILVVLLALFFRHARIIDYTMLYRRLKEVDELKDDFVSMASHELRTPLTAIRGYAELLGDSLKGADAQAREHLSRIELSAKALEELISDMLDVSRIEQGRLQFTMKPLDPNAILGEVCESLAQHAKDRGLALKREFAEGLHITADETRFRQIAVNLIGNAIKYTEHGDVTVRTYREKDMVVVRVSDTGIGMNAEEREQLFEKFYRSSNAQVRAKTGTGLGLWITKQLVEGMNGRISVESIENVGTHVVASFPALAS